MTDAAYLARLEAAGFIMGPPRVKGMPIWADAGLRAAELLAEQFAALVSARYRVTVLEHPFLRPAASYRAVFGGYDNVYAMAGVRDGEEQLGRPDNLVSNVRHLDRHGSAGPLISGDGLLRNTPGKTPPLFRDRYIWPAVQLTHLVLDDMPAAELLDYYRVVMERLLAAAGLPTITVRTPALTPYGKLTYLTIGCLPNGAPTVLATLYVLSDRLRDALGQRHDVVDVGFTGKILALCAMHHHDHRGLVLPSLLAPVQVGVTAAATTSDLSFQHWLSALRSAGIRADAGPRCQALRQRNELEQRWQRSGTPLVIGVDRVDGLVRCATRGPARRTDLSGLPSATAIKELLAKSDSRLLNRSGRLLATRFADQALLLGVCDSCAVREAVPVFGRVVPERQQCCQVCGTAQGRLAFVTAAGRFY